MALPWYATGAARPEYAKYKGSEQDDAARKAVADALKRKAPTYRPANTKTSTTTRYRPAPAGADPVVDTFRKVVNTVKNFGGEPGKSDDIARAQAARKKREEIEARWQAIQDERKKNVQAPFGLRWDAYTGAPATTPGVGLAGRNTSRERSEAATAARLTGAADAYEKRQTAERELEREESELAEAPDREEEVVELTLEEWNAMTAAQQNAVRFNTDLVAAVQRDKEMQEQYDPTVSEQAAYDAVLRDVFGTTASASPEGIEYAPETVGLLKNLNTLPAQELGSLDDFLKLDVAITAKQVERIEQQLHPTGPEHLVGRNELSDADQRLERAQALSRAQGQISNRLQGELERGKRLISDMSTENNTAAAEEFGAVLDEAAMPQLSDERAQDLNTVIEYLADPANDVQEGVAGLSGLYEEKGYSAQEQQTFYTAMLEALRESATTGGTWFDPEATGIQWRTPQQVAGALGQPLQKVD